MAAALSGVAEVDEGADGAATEVIVGASLLRVREQLASAATREPVEPPAALAATLRDYQRHGLTWLDQLTSLGLGACLADDMGLGKTVTLIALALHRAAREGGSGPTLVVCPASLLGNWQAEVERFAPGVPVRRFHGSRRDLPASTPGRPAFVLTTYGTMRSRRETHDVAVTVPWSRGTWSSPTRPSTSRTPGRPRPGRCAGSRARPGSPSPAPPSRTTSPSSGRSSTGRPRGCSAAATRSAGSGPRRSSRASTRP